MLLPVSDIIKQSIALYKDYLPLWLRYIGLLLFPTVLTGIVTVPFSIGLKQQSIPTIVITCVLLFLTTLITLYISIPFIRTMAAVIDGKKPASIKDSLIQAKPAFWPLVSTSILVGLIIAAGFIFFIIPGIIFLVWFAFTSYAIILDGKQPKDAIQYSKSLVMGRWWAVAWRLIVPTILIMFISWIAQSIVAWPFDAALAIEPMQWVSVALVLVSSLASTVVTLLFVPLSTAAPTLLYRALKENR